MKSPDHTIRWDRLQRVLRGVHVGDAFGQAFFLPEAEVAALVDRRELPPPAWFYTDDTVMSWVLAGVLAEFGEVRPDELAKRFAATYREDPLRAYGGSVQALLRGVAAGQDWRELSRAQFSGMGSYGCPGRKAFSTRKISSSSTRIVGFGAFTTARWGWRLSASKPMWNCCCAPAEGISIRNCIVLLLPLPGAQACARVFSVRLSPVRT